ncbi:hypothetical protein L2E69_05960 [Planktothrix agardhii 1806]|jgi:hypothetical protein|uniref:Uncharacterized protein n=1 Tax=Planktothrix rubescens CCAP 1459/22 TaxID=329571 RepID=A0A6J7ZJ51_PLARU|nr:hypothetical protein [Planktothrix agardhii]MCB8781578.1 hypothetical protein [Planktothrix agardhii 1808]MCB8785868.1 hypothetical protein [Planktothrix agardhii 1025]MCF3615486.1 hypothetical protein [Planktothrix agardhii 1806]CAC5342124.1 hypothetical protein PLAN_160014 [Planktothrix rubescens NIVA-CYA 18]MCF3567236.1 hypothetical protein [Planktothrix agardhii 1807]
MANPQRGLNSPNPKLINKNGEKDRSTINENGEVNAIAVRGKDEPS